MEAALGSALRVRTIVPFGTVDDPRPDTPVSAIARAGPLFFTDTATLFGRTRSVWIAASFGDSKAGSNATYTGGDRAGKSKRASLNSTTAAAPAGGANTVRSAGISGRTAPPGSIEVTSDAK